MRMVKVRVNEGHVYCEDEQRRDKIHPPGTELTIPQDRVNHCVTVLEPEPKGKPQHRMIESPTGHGRKP
jgi:hypothetical protein